jgi:hypothetical protein
MTTLKRHGCNKYIDYEELATLPLPLARKRFVPMAHKDLYDRTVKNLSMLDYEVVNPKFLTDHTGLKFAASFSVTHPNLLLNNDYDMLIALVSSLDGSLASKLLAGHNTYLCSNQYFGGEQLLSRKHTRNAGYDINTKLRDFAFNLHDLQKGIFADYESLKEYDFSSKREVNDFVVQTCEQGILPWQHAPKVLEHWNNPEHPEFEDRNAYCLSNAYTSHWRGINQFTLPQKTIRLRKFIDEFKRKETTNIETIEQGPGELGEFAQRHSGFTW